MMQAFQKRLPWYLLILFVGASMILFCHALSRILWYQQSLSLESLFLQDGLLHAIEARPQKPERREVKGLYLTAYAAANPTKRMEIIDLINTTELNAVVIDIKDYTGYVLYDSDVEWVNTYDLEYDVLGDVQAIIDDFHAHDIYVIARQTVFQDPILAEQRSDLSLQRTGGGLWRDHKGLAWVDPANETIWPYHIAITKEAIDFGFDEINFDYVRFPTDGNMATLVYTHGDLAKHDVMHDFFTYLSEELTHEPAYISLDFFGFVMERHDGMTIGQRLEDAVDVVDYICPMMYPSHYPSGHLGLSNPAAAPGIVIEHGMQKGAPYFEGTRAEVRPWIQAFNIGAIYGATNIRAQIDAVEEYTDGGWLLWNAATRYSDAWLLSVE